MSRYGLALHTTSAQLGLAISNFAEDSRKQTWELGRQMSTHLHQYLAEFLAPQTWADLAFIAVAKGPGSFTSTRLGLVTARTLGQQLEIPVFAISTLAAVAWQEGVQEQKNSTLAVQMEARRDELFVGIYQVANGGKNTNKLQVELLDTIIKAENWQQKLADLNTIDRVINVPINLGFTVDSILAIAYENWQQGKRTYWSEAVPFYGQSPV